MKASRLAILLAMAMFVLVVDTSLMDVSISAVVHDLDKADSSDVLPAAEKEQVAQVLEDDAELMMSNAFRMVRLPDPPPSGSGEAMALA